MPDPLSPIRLHRINPLLTARARQLRVNAALAERILWPHLRNRKLCGLKFRRQAPLGPFIADLYCAAHRLIIELDGESHEDRFDHDQQRTKWLNDHGHRVLRFLNEDVYDHTEAVLKEIARACDCEWGE